MRTLVILIFAVLFLLTGCFTGPPVVSILPGSQTVTSGQILNLDAALADPDVPDNFAFQWYVDHTAVSGAVTNEFSYVLPVVEAATDISIKVTADAAGRGIAESEITISVLPSYVTHLSSSGSFTYSVNLGSNPLSVYFIFTNGGESEAARPLVTPNFSVSKQIQLLPVSQAADGRDAPVAWRGRPEVTEFNRNPPPFEVFSGDVSRSLVFPAPDGPLYDTEGDTGTINDGDVDVASTCWKVVDADGKRLNIWVADADWGAVTGKVNQDMVDALAARFMKAGTDNDIYDWVTGIFGAEWGSHLYSNLIPPDNEITILIYDIGEPGLPDAGEGRIVGFYNSLNNYIASSSSEVADSNERLMFFIDAALFADDTGGGGWSITDDFWPREVVSTLAHEFQHMIHFYQKAVRNGVAGTADVWINEMCSMAAEDLISDKILTDGPRGVAYDDGTAGSPGNTSDRLAGYNYYNDSSLTYWPSAVTSAEDTLPHYSLSYSFGAYLARNYNGPELFRRIVQNGETDSKAVTSALASGGWVTSFTGILQQWGAAVLLSDMSSFVENYDYNNAGFFNFSLDGIVYNAGSVNLYNYYYNVSGEQQSGPKLYTSSPVGQSVLAAASNTFYFAGSGLSGTKSWTISIPDQVKMTVVFR